MSPRKSEKDFRRTLLSEYFDLAAYASEVLRARKHLHKPGEEPPLIPKSYQDGIWIAGYIDAQGGWVDTHIHEVTRDSHLGCSDPLQKVWEDLGKQMHGTKQRCLAAGVDEGELEKIYRFFKLPKK